MQQQQGRPPKPQEPVIEFKVQTMLAVFAIVLACVAVVMSFTIIGPTLAYVGIAIGLAALCYVAFLLVLNHQERRERAKIELRRQEALAKREEIINEQQRALADQERVKALRLVQPDATGNYPVWIDDYGQAHVFQPGNLIQPVPQTYSPHIDYRIGGPGQLIQPVEVPAIAGPLELPGPVSMIEVMRHWDLTPEHLFLALAKGGKSLACSIEQFMHVAHDGPTGSGKTWQWKAEMIMLLKAEVLCFLANPHFAPVSKKGEDWRPIGRALEQQELPGQLPGLLYNAEQIRDFLKWLASVEIDRRYALQRAGRYDYPPLYGFIDEWAEQVEAYPECARYMKTIIRRGRAVEICVSTNSQGFLVADTGLNSSVRENYQTAYDLGSSPASAAAMLDMEQKAIRKLLATEQIALGRGIALLRNNAVSDPAQIVRLPLADNNYVYWALGRADDWKLPEYCTVSEVVSGPTGQSETDNETDELAREALSAAVTAVSGETEKMSIKQAAAAVSDETKRRILRDIHRGHPYRLVASNVGMSGGGYEVFQQICRDLGYDTSKRNPHSKGAR